ncbi:MAG: YggS family pyridoxal phosphate-dependent enzyme [Thermoguttaceae bacterium]
MNPDPTSRRIAENLAEVRGRIAEAAARSGRRAEELLLVAVTKYVGIELIEPLIDAGATLLGESRPQQLWSKAEALAGRSVRWHMIGQLQRNKIRRTLPLVELIHSGEDIRHLEAIDRIAAELPQPARVLLEVNVSGDRSKHGLSPDELERGLPELGRLMNLEIRGLMCMAGLETDAEGARRDFAALRELRDRLQPACPERVSLGELSMGMSGDFEAAIQEGATIVRVGSALFEGVSE